MFYVASRGHHADIGGITPGSMPPHSTSLQQEGAVFLSFKLVQGGVFQEEGEWHWAGTPGCLLPTFPPGRPPGWGSQAVTPKSGCTVSLTDNRRHWAKLCLGPGRPQWFGGGELARTLKGAGEGEACFKVGSCFCL